MNPPTELITSLVISIHFLGLRCDVFDAAKMLSMLSTNIADIVYRTPEKLSQTDRGVWLDDSASFFSSFSFLTGVGLHLAGRGGGSGGGGVWWRVARAGRATCSAHLEEEDEQDERANTEIESKKKSESNRKKRPMDNRQDGKESSWYFSI